MSTIPVFNKLSWFLCASLILFLICCDGTLCSQLFCRPLPLFLAGRTLLWDASISCGVGCKKHKQRNLFINCSCFTFNKITNKCAAFLTNKNAELAPVGTLPSFHITSEEQLGALCGCTVYPGSRGMAREHSGGSVSSSDLSCNWTIWLSSVGWVPNCVWRELSCVLVVTKTMKICLWSSYFKIKNNLWKSLSLPPVLSALSKQELPFFPNINLPGMFLLILSVLHWPKRYQTCVLMMSVDSSMPKMRIFFGVLGACESSSVPGERSEPVSFRHWVHALHSDHHRQGELGLGRRSWPEFPEKYPWQILKCWKIECKVFSHPSDLEICACLLFYTALKK